MLRAAIVLLLLTPMASAQRLVPAGDLARVQRLFQPRTDAAPLPCDVTPLPPSLNFTFRFQAGYAFRVAQSQYPATTSGWSVLTSITPDGGVPTSLLARYHLVDATRVGPDFDLRGMYYLGEGRYSVVSTLRDDRNRVCRKQWQIVVEPAHADRAVPMSILPNTIRQFTPIVPPELQFRDSAASMRISVLLNAAAFSTARTNIRPYDRTVLFGALTSLLEHLPAASVRLVAFSLEQQQEIFRSEHFAASESGKVAAAIRSLQSSTVDVHILEKPLGYVDFLAGLLAREHNAPDPADTILFLGPTSRYGGKMPESALPVPTGARFFYVRYENLRRAMPNVPNVYSGGTAGDEGRPIDSVTVDENIAQTIPVPRQLQQPGGGGRRNGHYPDPPSNAPMSDGRGDIISAAVARLKGKTLTIHTPADLANAIRKIEGRQ
jgi:hypothetical protein